MPILTVRIGILTHKGTATCSESMVMGRKRVGAAGLLVLLLVGALPTWPYSAAWGYYPSSGLGVLLLVVLVLVLASRRRV